MSVGDWIAMGALGVTIMGGGASTAIAIFSYLSGLDKRIARLETAVEFIKDMVSSITPGGQQRRESALRIAKDG